MASSTPSADVPSKQLTLFDATSIIVGIVVGAGIYSSTSRIAASLSGPVALGAAWLLGGLVAYIGAMCYAELATTYTSDGGDYVYLTRAYGPRVGFLFSWAQLWVIRPGSIGAMAYVFAEYAAKLLHAGSSDSYQVVYAAGAITVLSGLNLLGVREGKWTQNLLTTAKVIGLLLIVGAACFASGPSSVAEQSAASADNRSFGYAMIMIMFTYGGWNDMTYVAAEVRQPEKNLVRALLFGTLAITAIYLAVNFAFVRVLGFAGVGQSEAVAADTLQAVVGDWGSRAISVLVCISCLGAINGMVLTGARIYYAVGRQHPLFAPFGTWSRQRGTPVRALLLQAVITLLVVIGIGLYKGSGEGFRSMVIFTALVFWFFFFLTGTSLLVLRNVDRERTRPYRVLFYPVTPLMFCAACVFMVYSTLVYAAKNAAPEAYWAVGILVIGVGLSFLGKPSGDASDAGGAP